MYRVVHAQSTLPAAAYFICLNQHARRRLNQLACLDSINYAKLLLI